MIAKFADIRASVELSSTAKLVAETIERETPRNDNACLLSSKSIGALVGCSERSARNALRALEAVGLVEISRDYGLKTRRRIVLKWRVSTTTKGGAQ